MKTRKEELKIFHKLRMLGDTPYIVLQA